MEHDPNCLTPEEKEWVEEHDGKLPPYLANPQLFRINKQKPNEPCHCGSGKKFKRCHWTGEAQYATHAQIERARALLGGNK